MDSNHLMNGGQEEQLDLDLDELCDECDTPAELTAVNIGTCILYLCASCLQWYPCATKH